MMCYSCVRIDSVVGLSYSDGKVANRAVRAIAHAAVSRRPPISLPSIVARTEGYTYAAEV
jgi:hypothetical protein